MKKVITYGTYDLLHFGHIRLLERAKSLGDYLIVGVTADDFDKTRGKINVHQSLIERVEAVKRTGLADKIIIEEYEGQKIDDIKKYEVDIFTVGSDWIGKFDYLSEYCEVVYLERTEGVSSSEIREKERPIKIGLAGNSSFLNKVAVESQYVNGIHINALCTSNIEVMSDYLKNVSLITDDFDVLLDHVDAVYLRTSPEHHYKQIKIALEKGKHVICESPLSMHPDECAELFRLADKNKCILMEAIKTAYSTAYSRLLLLAKSGKIGDIVSVQSTCTSLRNDEAQLEADGNSITDWGPTALLPIFQLLGVELVEKKIVTKMFENSNQYDAFSKIDMIFENAIGSALVAKGVKSEGELIVSGTKGYIYVPAPWWKTDYFEIRYENASNNKRYFYQLEGEGIRYEFVAFERAIQNGVKMSNISNAVSCAISEVINDYRNKKNVIVLG